jgi:hypothetical protein
MAALPGGHFIVGWDHSRSWGCGERSPEIKQVSPFLALIEGPELGAEEFVKLIGRNGGYSGKPARLDGKGIYRFQENDFGVTTAANKPP